MPHQSSMGWITQDTATELYQNKTVTNQMARPSGRHDNRTWTVTLEVMLHRVFWSQPPTLTGILIALTTITFNSLCLFALYRFRKHFLIQHRLIVSLACSDVLISLAFLLYVTNKSFGYMGTYGGHDVYECFQEVIRALNMSCYAISLLNLIAMATNPYLAIVHSFFYERWADRAPVNAILLIMWMLAFLLGFSDFFTWKEAIRHKREYTVCGAVKKHPTYSAQYAIYALGLLTLVYTGMVYARIYYEVHKIQRSANHDQALLRNRRALVLGLLIVGAFMLCFLPMTIFELTITLMIKLNPQTMISLSAERTRMLRGVGAWLQCFFQMNTLFDPLIYMFRMREVRERLRVLCTSCICSKCCEKRAEAKQNGEVAKNRVLSITTRPVGKETCVGMNLRSLNQGSNFELPQSTQDDGNVDESSTLQEMSVQRPLFGQDHACCQHEVGDEEETGEEFDREDSENGACPGKKKKASDFSGISETTALEQ